jgi:hypothetical protein
MNVSKMIAATAAVAMGLLVACSSSSSKGGSNVPTCQGATQGTGSGSDACNSCVESSCGSQISAAESACSSYFSCYSACQCSDYQCIAGCVSNITSSCETPFMAVDTCLTSSCAAECNTASTDAGTGAGG